MIIGGAFQGKAAFAEKKYPEIEWVNGADADWNSIQNAKGVVNFHEFIRAEMKKNEDVSDLAEKLIQCNPGSTPRIGRGGIWSCTNGCI